MAEWVATAIGRVSRYSAGWLARQTLHASVEALLEVYPDAAVEDVSDLLLDLLDDEIAEAVFALDGRLLVYNDQFAARTDLDLAQPPEPPRGAMTGHGCTRIADQELWDRLVAGDTDFLDQLAAGCETQASGLHWAVARRRDATPVVVVATFDSLAGRDGGKVSGEPGAGGKGCLNVCNVARPVTFGRF